MKFYSYPYFLLDLETEEDRDPGHVIVETENVPALDPENENESEDIEDIELLQENTTFCCI